MAFFNGWPWANFQEQNLDWIIKSLKKLQDDLSKIEQGETDTKFTFLSELGADPAGGADASEILTNYFNNLDPDSPALLIVDGRFYINGALGATPRNLSFLFMDGGQFNFGPSGAAYWKSEILNTDGKIFTGNLESLEIYGITIRPEWFGAKNDGVTDSAAAINQAIKCAYHTDILLKSGTKTRKTDGSWTPTINCYKVESPILLNNAYVALVGEEPAAVICSTTLTNIVKIGSQLTGSRIERCRLENIEFVTCHNSVTDNDPESSGSYTIDVIGLEAGTLYNLRILGNPNGIYITQTSGVKFERITVNAALAYDLSIVRGRMFFIDADNRNTSNVFEDCGGSNGSLQNGHTGLVIAGDASVRDTFFRRFEVSNIGNGIIITATGSASGNNILIDNAVLDQIGEHALLIDGTVPREFIRFINSYIWQVAGATVPAIDNANTGRSSVLLVDNCELNTGNRQIPTVRCSNGLTIVSKCFFRNCGLGILCTGTAAVNAADSDFTDYSTAAIDYFIKVESSDAGSKIQSCIFNNISGESSVANAIELTGGNTSVMFNDFYGYITNQVSGDAHASIIINRQTSTINKAPGF